MQGQKVHGRHEVLGVDVRGGHIAGEAAALTGERGIKGQSQETALGHGLGVEAGALLLDRAKGAADRDSGQPALRRFRHVQVARQGDAVAVYEAHLAVLDRFTFREGLVPDLGQIQIFHFHHGSSPLSLIDIFILPDCFFLR